MLNLQVKLKWFAVVANHWMLKF